MKRSEFRLLDRLRVRWAEIDAQNIVFNGHYLMYFDTAVASYWRALAMPYAQTMEQLGGDMFVRKATVEYFGPARYDDLLDIGIRCAHIGTSSMRFVGVAFRQDEPLVSCELVYVFADPHTHTSKPVPAALRDLLESFEAGAEMIELRVGSWQDLGSDAQAIRTEVFIGEQKIRANLEWDAADHDAIHVLARNRLGLALATGRVQPHAPGVAKIGRMAVRQAVRGSGVGRAVLDALVRAAKQRGDREVVLHAQASAAAFYASAGFNSRGAPFDEAGISHVEMVRSL